MIRMAVTGSVDTENQVAIEALVSQVNITMVGMLIYAVFLAPVVEEIVFRGLVVNYFSVTVGGGPALFCLVCYLPSHTWAIFQRTCPTY